MPVLEVSTSGTTGGANVASARAQADVELTSRMNAIHERSHGTTARRAFMPNSRPRAFKWGASGWRGRCARQAWSA